LIKIGFIHNIADTNVYIKRVENSLMIISLFVDGYIIVFNDPHKLLPQTKEIFKSKFEMIDMGEIEYFLGIHITHNR
jgi:hypothetical protein